MKPGVDLTEDLVFRERRFPGAYIPGHERLTGIGLGGTDPILRRAGIQTFMTHDIEFPPTCLCDCCGRLIPPWRGTRLCRGCGGEIVMTSLRT